MPMRFCSSRRVQLQAGLPRTSLRALTTEGAPRQSLARPAGAVHGAMPSGGHGHVSYDRFTLPKTHADEEHHVSSSCRLFDAACNELLAHAVAVHSCRAWSCHAMLRHATVLPCLVSHAMVCHAMPCHAMPCHAMPCHAMPCHSPAVLVQPCHGMPCHAVPCHAMPCRAMHAAPCLQPLLNACTLTWHCPCCPPCCSVASTLLVMGISQVMGRCASSAGMAPHVGTARVGV